MPVHARHLGGIIVDAAAWCKSASVAGCPLIILDHAPHAGIATRRPLM
jgi:hypothetical protein